MKTWVYKYGDDTIVVNNSLSSCELLINGSRADTKDGLMIKAELSATLKNGEEVRAELGGALAVDCALFIDGVLHNPTGKE